MEHGNIRRVHPQLLFLEGSGLVCDRPHWGLFHSDFYVYVSKAHPLNSWAMFVGAHAKPNPFSQQGHLRGLKSKLEEIRPPRFRKDAFHISYVWQNGLGSVFMSSPNKQYSKVHSLAPWSSVPKPCNSNLVAWPTEHCHWAAPYPSQLFLGNLLRHTGGWVGGITRVFRA